MEMNMTRLFADGATVDYYNPETPAIAKDKRPYMSGGRVVSIAKGKEFEVVYATRHENATIQSFYEEFKMSDNKLFWLSENRARLEKFNIDVDKLISAHKPTDSSVPFFKRIVESDDENLPSKLN